MDRVTLDAIVAEVEGYMDRDTTCLWEQEGPHSASHYCDPAWLVKEQRVQHSFPIDNRNRTVGTLLSYFSPRNSASKACPKTRSTCNSPVVPARASAPS